MKRDAASSTSPPEERLASLSPAKRALFERLRSAAKPSAALPHHDPSEPAPLSPAQERLWFLDQLEPGNPFYNVAVRLRLSGTLDVRALGAALRLVIERHDALRTVFHTVAGRPEQIVQPTTMFQLEHEDLHGLTDAARVAAVARITQAEALRPFNLSRGPLIRARLLTVAPDDHVLLLTLHHIICDGWSMAVLRDEVAEQYTTIMAGHATRLPPLPCQYADFSLWQQIELQGDNSRAHLDYWRAQLQSLPGPLSLPIDRPRPAVQTYHGNTCRRRIDSRMTGALRQLAAEENATLCMVLLASFQVVLARLSRDRDICVGLPIANRLRPEFEKLIGFFVNTLVIRGRLEDNPSFRQYLAQIRQTLLQAYEHQEVPFSRLVEELVPTRELSRSPLVQVMFVLQNIPRTARSIAGLTITEQSFDHAPVSNFDLTLNVDEHADRLDLSLVYNTDLFHAATIERLLDGYLALLSGVLADRDCSTLALPLVTTAEREQLLVTWNETDRPVAAERCIHELFSAQARRTPQAVALRYEGQEITYEDLDVRTNRLAQYLITQGATVDEPIGVCLPRSPELITTLLAILKAGAAYLPIDPLYPASRRAAMIADAQLRLIVCNRETVNCVAEGTHRTIFVEEATNDGRESTDCPPPRATSANVAYVIYTSGSTGLPKGVMVPHRGLVNHATAIARECNLQPGDSVLQYLSLSFDAAAEEIFPALTSGATLHLHPAPAELSGRVLLDWSRENQVNVLHLPVAVWSSLFEEVSRHGLPAVRHLKTVLAGGDTLSAEQVRQWRRATGDRVRFLFAYGVTESTITSTLFDASIALPETSSNCLPIGRPIDNTRLYVLDELQQPVPIGVAGELYIGGVSTALGYLRRPELTAERFLSDPFSDTPGARMYRTGDLVRYLPDGNLEFLGRADRQVKVRGYRIEPAEIEAVLQLHPHVGEAIVVTCGQGEDKRLAAYVGTRPGLALTAEELRTFLSTRLPGHMLPAAISVLEELPRLACAKVDVAALPAPNWERGETKVAFVAPQTPAEQALAQIWAEVLGRAAIGVHDNFFDIGGDSIRSIQVVARAGATGWRITPKLLFQNQTIAQLAQVAEPAPTMATQQEPVIGPVPLLPIQHEFFALGTADPHHHNQSVLLTVSPLVTHQMLGTALRKLLTHHDVLRSRFADLGSASCAQEIEPPAEDSALAVVDLADLCDGELSATIEAQAAEFQASLNLEQGPVVRFVLFACGPARPARLLMVIHHLVVDAVSWRILLSDLNLVCQQLVRGDAPALPLKTTSICQWARRLQEMASSSGVQDELAFWTNQTVTPAAAPAPTKPNLVGSSATVCHVLDATTTDRLFGEAQTAYRAKGQELLVAGLVKVLADYEQSKTVCLNLEGHGREDLFDDVDLSCTVGWFTALFPVCFMLPTRHTPGIAVRVVKEQCRAVPRGGLGYGLLRWLSPDAAVRQMLAARPQPTIGFNFLGRLDNALPADALFQLAAESPGPVVSPRGARRHLWEIITFVHDGRLHIEWHFNRDVHDRTTVAALTTDFAKVLGDLVDSVHTAESEALAPVDFPLAELDQEELAALGELLADE